MPFVQVRDIDVYCELPPANMERLAERIPDSRLHLFEGGHLFLLQDPAAWQAVVEFITG